MRYPYTTCHRLRDHLGIGDIALDEAQTRVVQPQIAALAHGQIVQHAHPVTNGQQGIDQV